MTETSIFLNYVAWFLAGCSLVGVFACVAGDIIDEPDGDKSLYLYIAALIISIAWIVHTWQ